METFKYSENNESYNGQALQIPFIRNIKLSAYIEPDRLAHDIIPLLEYRKQIAIRLNTEQNEVNAKQLYEMMDYVNDQIRTILAL